jgi:hypothetical protein
MKRIDKKKAKEITEEDIKAIQFRDICGTATKAELRILKDRGIESFMLGTVDTSGFFPKDLDPKIKKYHEDCAKRHRKIVKLRK